MRTLPALALPVLLLAACSSSGKRADALVPMPALPSQSALRHCQNAQQARYAIERRDLCPDERRAKMADLPAGYVRDANACDPMSSTYVSTLTGIVLSDAEGAASERALGAFERSLAGVDSWWAPGWLGVARCRAAQGDLAAAHAALDHARGCVIELERRVVEGADPARKRSFFEILGLLPPPRDKPTGNSEALEVYFAMLRELARFELPAPSVELLSDRQLVERLRSQTLLLESELNAPGGSVGDGAQPSSAVLAMVLDPRRDKDYWFARWKLAERFYAAGRLEDAWATISPFLDGSVPTADAAVTSRDARFLRLGANIARRVAASKPGATLHGNEASKLAERLYAQVRTVNPAHSRAALEAADNLLTYIEQDPAGHAAMRPYVQEYLDVAERTREECADQTLLEQLSGRLAQLPGRRSQ